MDRWLKVSLPRASVMLMKQVEVTARKKSKKVLFLPPVSASSAVLHNGIKQ